MTDMISVEASIHLKGSLDYVLSAVIIIIVRRWLYASTPHLHYSSCAVDLGAY